MIKLVIFDLDGTLLDTVSTLAYYVNRAIGKHGLAPITDEECKVFVGNGARLLIERALRSRGAYTPELHESCLSDFSMDYRRDVTYLTAPYEGVVDTLTALRARGYKTAVLSNKPDVAARAVVGALLPPVFDEVRGARDGIALKPSPDGALELIRSLGFSPSEVAYVGDTDVDMKTGRAMGARLTVGVSWGFRSREELLANGADVILDSPRELISEVEKIV